MSADSIRHRIALALSIPPEDVEVAPPGARSGRVRVRGRSWALTRDMVDQAEEVINRVVFACRQSPGR